MLPRLPSPVLLSSFSPRFDDYNIVIELDCTHNTLIDTSTAHFLLTIATILTSDHRVWFRPNDNGPTTTSRPMTLKWEWECQCVKLWSVNMKILWLWSTELAAEVRSCFFSFSSVKTKNIHAKSKWTLVTGIHIFVGCAEFYTTITTVSNV